MTMLTRAAGRLRRHFRSTPELRAWREACREARHTPRRTPGRIQLAQYDIAYADLMTLCPQWHDIFVRRTLDVALSRSDPRILDCGANIGLASLFFKSRYPAARIRAYEADPTLAAILQENVRRNAGADVEVIPAAVWTHHGSVAFRHEGADLGAVADVAGTAVAGAERSVACVRLRDVLAEERVDFLKLDIEGAEAAVLADAAPMLANVDALAVEVHEFDPKRRQLAHVLYVLSAAGFRWTLDELLPLPWMSTAPASGPFAHAPDAWVVLVKAWRA